MLRDRMIDRVVGADVDVEPVVDVRKSPTDQDILEVVGIRDHLVVHAIFHN